LDLLEKLSNDESLYVRFNIANNLHILYRKDKTLCFKIIEKYGKENWFTRYCLLSIMSFFYKIDTEIGLELQIFRKILEHSAEDKKHSSDTMRHAIHILMHHALKNDNIKSFLNSLMDEGPESVFIHIAQNCGFGDEITSEGYQDYIIDLNTRMLDHSSPYVRDYASYSFLSNLINHNTSLFPRVKNYLEKLSTLRSIGNDSRFAFTIFRYLNHFHKEFPNASCSYLGNVFKSNKVENLGRSIYNMFSLIDNLLSLDPGFSLKNSLVMILRECSKRGNNICKYQADLLLKKYRFY
jgi:hypothetical protein